jgi:hypothetical protein
MIEAPRVGQRLVGVKGRMREVEKVKNAVRQFTINADRVSNVSIARSLLGTL